MEASGLLICLSARPEVVLQRLAQASDRPLLATSYRQQRITSLLLERTAAYNAIPHQLDTSDLSVAQVAEQVVRLARRQGPGPIRIPVCHPGGRYEIVVADGLLIEAGHLLVEAGLPAGRCAVVTNPDIGAAHGERLLAGLAEAGFDPLLIHIPEGEAHKTLATVAGLYDRFIAAGLDRRSPIIALGGGVVGDVTGFAAATYLRGAPFVQVPTSLLAMVDASVGGKTGVDLPQGKNLVGAFKQPAGVIIDPEVLSTLPAAEFRSGLGEVVKHGIIANPTLFADLEAGVSESLGDLVAEAVRVKVTVVESDPFEQGRRAVLNLGHTFAHALEVLSDYQLRHGEAVSIGLAAATRLAARLEECDPALVSRVEGLLTRLDLATRTSGPTPQQVLAAMRTDKKRVGNRLRFVLPRAIGDVDLFDDVPENAVVAVITEITQ